MKDLYTILQEIGIPYIKHEHPAVFTCEEADEFYKDVPGGKSKNLFLRNKKGNRHYLVIIESHKKIEIKKLAQLLGEPDLGFASEERMMKFLGLTPGSVSPFGLINDTNKEVIVVLDEDLLKHERLHYHPLINTATLELSREDFQRFLAWCGNAVRVVEV